MLSPVIISFLAIHCYTFVLLIIALSFYLFCRQQIDRVTDANNLLPGLLERERREKLDPYVTAVHQLNRRLLKRKRRAIAGLDQLSDAERNRLYGVQRTEPKRLRVLGYKPRLYRYARKDVIYVPEISPDSRRCDLWNERQDVSYLVKCDVREGEEACFKCIESRRFVRKCVHVGRPIRVSLQASGNGDYIDIPANEQKDEGYCLSRVFANIVDDGTVNWRPGGELAQNCNPNTGTWLLARQSVHGDSTYNWLCRCRYPNLMTNLTTVFSDCLRPVGCQPNGHLDEATSAGLVNPYVSGRCICGKGYKSGYDKTIGPVCEPQIVVSEDSLPQQVYRDHKLNMSSLLHWPRDANYLDERLARISGNNPEGLSLPNPCHYDAVTYRLIDFQRRCELVTERIGQEYVAYCVTRSVGSAAVRASRDYLRNNNGRYSNACLLIEIGQGVTQTENYILSYQVSRNIENARPDFGVLYETSSQLNRIIWYLVDNDPEWRRFTHQIKYPKRLDNPVVDATRRAVLIGKDVDSWISVYEQIPLESVARHGLKDQVMSMYESDNNREGAVYNVRERTFFWYCFRNPLGATHWNHGRRRDMGLDISFWPGGIAYPRILQTFVPGERKAWAYRKGEEKPITLHTGTDDESFVHTAVGSEPEIYPGWKMVMPFASGSDVDDDDFTNRFYPGLFPIYKRPELPSSPSLAEKIPKMPFVFNTRSEYMDSTLTVHVDHRRNDPNSPYAVWVMSEQICGNYRNHYKTMRNRLQGTYV